MKHLLRKILTLLRLAGLALAAAIVAGWLLGRITSDRYAWSQWLLWVPTPAALAGTLLGLLLASIGTRQRTHAAAWAGGGIVILLYFTALEHRFLRGRPPEVLGLRLVNCNVLPRARPPLVATLVGLDGDLTILSSPLAPDPLREFGRRLGPSGEPIILWPFMAFSQLPIIEARHLVAHAEIRIAMVRVQPEDWERPITIYAIDLPSDLRRPRIDVARTARRLLEQIEAPPPDVVVGDFNMTRGSASLQTLFPELAHAYDQAGRGYGATFRRGLPLYHLDHALLADTVRATEYSLVDPGVGRHLIQVVNIVPDQ